MAAKLILMRHGTTKNAPDPPLSDIGLTEVHMASDKVAGWDVACFFSSPANRCVSTARILAKPNNVAVKVDDRLSDGATWSSVSKFVEEIRTLNGSVVAVTHAPVIKSVLVQLLGVEAGKIDMDRISPLSYSVIELDGSGFKASKLLTDMFYESSKLFT